jgi:hypothetical protein
LQPGYRPQQQSGSTPAAAGSSTPQVVKL